MLVPRWLRRSHVAPSDLEVFPDQNEADQADPATPATPESSVAAAYSVTASYCAEVTYSAETAGPGVPVAPAAHGGGPAAHRGPVGGRRHPQVPMRPPGPAPHILQARRRTLTMLITITIAVMGAALAGLTPWWISVPPFVMLGMYLLLLREAAHADAEHARSWAQAHDRAAHAAQLARERARQAHVAPPPEPTAEIINISGAGAAWPASEVYDQYADQVFRAVGD